MVGRRASITASVLDVIELEAKEQQLLEKRLAKRKLLLLPDSPLLGAWLCIIGPLIVYNVIWVPLEVSQMAVASKRHAQADFVLDFFFYIDIIINFRTAFVDTSTNEVVLDFKRIAKRYLYGSFAVDFVATIQWELFIFGVTPFSEKATDTSVTAAISVLRLPRLLRLVRLFKKLDVYPSLKIFKLAFLFLLVSHWVGCCWFLIGFLAIEQHRGGHHEAVAPGGSLHDDPAFAGFPVASEGSFGDSWLLRLYGSKDLDVKDNLDLSVAQKALLNASSIRDTVGLGQIYITSLYWSFTMLMKSPPPMIGPDTWLEKVFCCFMVLIGLFVTTQLVAVVTQMVLSFDKANAAFRDRQQEYTRFASSRSLPGELRRKLLTYSLHDWGVTQGFDPLEVIKREKIPPAISNAMLRAAYDDIVSVSPLLRSLDTPVCHVLLKYMKVVVCLQKEVLVSQTDPCSWIYILRSGALQAAASDKLVAASASPTRQSTYKNSRQSTWKAKMQVRMIERPGDVICCRSPYEPVQCLPFQITSVKFSVLAFMPLPHLLMVLQQVDAAAKDQICKVMAAEYEQILKSVRPKARDSTRESTRESTRDSAAEKEAPEAHLEPLEGGAGAPAQAAAEEALRETLGEARLRHLEQDVEDCIAKMGELKRQAKLIPRMVVELSRRLGKPLQPMPRGAQDAVAEVGMRATTIGGVSASFKRPAAAVSA